MAGLYVYILASKRNGLLYIGTSDLVKRIWEHKEKLRQRFTQRCNYEMIELDSDLRRGDNLALCKPMLGLYSGYKNALLI